MAKLFGKKKMTGMAPPAGSPPSPGMGSMFGGIKGGGMMGGLPPIPKKAIPKPKPLPVMKQKGTALSKFAPSMGKAPKKVAKKVPKKGVFPF